jgi:NTE family protein
MTQHIDASAYWRNASGPLVRTPAVIFGSLFYGLISCFSRLQHNGYRCVTALLATALFASADLNAATGQCEHPAATDRPKIGLVLGGGGARGYAHLGVLKKLEEMRIPYDYIAGTSMGSIVGGLLSTGMQSEEIIRVIRAADWETLLRDDTARADQPFRRKADDTLGLFGPKLGIGKDSNLLPKGMVSGHKVTFLFQSLVSQRVNTDDFDHLPIPYRAVATDIATGEMVVLGEGDLARAMRASMAVPAAFDPVRLDDHLLVDGGLARNLPVDVARDMGADVVIAVDVGTKLIGEEEITDALAIVYQISSLLIIHNTDVQIGTLADEDVLIAPALGETISSTDFDKLDEALPIGYTAAESVQARLGKYSLSEDAYQAWRRQVDHCVSGLPTVHFVQLDNRSRFSDEVIMELVHVKPGGPLDLEQLEHDLQQIYGLGFIRHASFNVVEKDGQQGIEISVSQDDRGTQFVETGMDLNFSGRGTDMNFRGGYLNTGLDKRGSEFRAMVQIGEAPGLFADYYRPLDNALRYSFHPALAVFRRPLLLYDPDGNALAEIELDEIGAAIALGREFGRYAKLIAGFTRYAGNMDITVGDPDLQPFSFDGAELFAELVVDRADDRYLPTRGFWGSMKYTSSVESLGADADFDQLEASFFSSHTFGLHNVVWGGQYNTSLDDDTPVYAWYSGGGFLNMSGFEPNSLVGYHYGQVFAGYRYQVGKSGILPAYVGTSLEYGNAAWERSDIFSDGLLNGSVYLGYKSPLGPVYLGLGWSEERDPIYFMRLGTIFGPRSLGRR